MSSDGLQRRLRAAFARTAPAGIVSAYLFGSHARRRAHRESDVDIGILLCHDDFPTPPSRFEERLRLFAHLAELLPKQTLDLVILNDAPPLLGRHIVTTGQRFFCADADGDRAFVRDVQLRSGRPRAVPAANPPRKAPSSGAMTYLVERLAELRRHLDHLYSSRSRVSGEQRARE